MDYVVAGFGIGAILALIGFALWELFGTAEEPGKTWLSRAAIGLMLGSLVIWAVTGVSLISHIDDSMGSRLVLVTTLVTLVSIVAGAFWYWRADRALAATLPRPATVSAQREVAVQAVAPVAQADYELTEWDSWPDRDAGLSAESGEAPAAAPSFEPEVAADAVVAASVEPEIVVEPIEPEVAVDAVVAAVVDPEVVPKEAVAAALVPAAPTPETLEVVVVEEPELPVEAIEPAQVNEEPVEPEPALPPNVRPIRVAAPALVVPSPGAMADAAQMAKTVDPVPVEAPSVDKVSATIAAAPATEKVAILVRPAPSPVEEPPADVPVEQPAEALPAFESSLLADIDGSLVDEEGGYRSPLLSDLGSDQLEGVGLAKWRPDARLTEDEELNAPPTKGARRR